MMMKDCALCRHLDTKKENIQDPGFLLGCNEVNRKNKRKLARSFIHQTQTKGKTGGFTSS